VYKQVIVVRKDLAMTAGKIAAQVAHAAVMGAEKTKSENINWFNPWYRSGQAKVVVKTKSFQELMKVRQHAESLDLTVVEVHDSGLTQLPPGTTTCIGIGPAPDELIDKVTGGLKLL
jgi:peptidyl-tRNA hydrolase, PTH2 family